MTQPVHIGVELYAIESSLFCLYEAAQRLLEFRDSLPMNSKDYHELGAIRELIRDGAGPLRAVSDNFEAQYRRTSIGIEV